MLRLLHTADWHLGHSLHGRARTREHDAFLTWLAESVVDEGADALLICGDVFETIHPSAAAQSAFFRFLATVRERSPNLDVVVVGGNHDSAARLEAAAPLLEAVGVRVVGAISRGVDGLVETERLCVPLHDSSGAIAAWCAAVPFLRTADLRPVDGDGDPWIAAVREVYDVALAAVRDRAAETGAAVVATGHGFWVGGEVSELSERRVLGGNQHALPADLFPDDVTYVALGHLHKAQRVGKRENLRYCGSPLPLSMAEMDYRHRVLAVDIEGIECRDVRSLPVPRTVEFLRVPARGHAPLADVLDALGAMPEQAEEIDESERPFLEVRVRIDAPEPDLRLRLEQALAGRPPRLVKIDVERGGTARRLVEIEPPDRRLRDLDPELVFCNAHEAAHESPPDDALLAEFRELLEEVRTDGGGP